MALSGVVLYRDNRVSGKYRITPKQLAAGFMTSRWRETWDEGWSLDRALLTYIEVRPVEGGLNSSFDRAEAGNEAAYTEARELILAANQERRQKGTRP